MSLVGTYVTNVKEDVMDSLTNFKPQYQDAIVGVVVIVVLLWSAHAESLSKNVVYVLSLLVLYVLLRKKLFKMASEKLTQKESYSVYRLISLFVAVFEIANGFFSFADKHVTVGLVQWSIGAGFLLVPAFILK